MYEVREYGEQNGQPTVKQTQRQSFYEAIRLAQQVGTDQDVDVVRLGDGGRGQLASLVAFYEAETGRIKAAFGATDQERDQVEQDAGLLAARYGKAARDAQQAEYERKVRRDTQTIVRMLRQVGYTPEGPRHMVWDGEAETVTLVIYETPSGQVRWAREVDGKRTGHSRGKASKRAAQALAYEAEYGTTPSASYEDAKRLEALGF